MVFSVRCGTCRVDIGAGDDVERSACGASDRSTPGDARHAHAAFPDLPLGPCKGCVDPSERRRLHILPHTHYHRVTITRSLYQADSDNYRLEVHTCRSSVHCESAAGAPLSLESRASVVSCSPSSLTSSSTCPTTRAHHLIRHSPLINHSDSDWLGWGSRKVFLASRTAAFASRRKICSFPIRAAVWSESGQLGLRYYRNQRTWPTAPSTSSTESPKTPRRLRPSNPAPANCGVWTWLKA